jgi:DNA-binding MarR family transcriptional regulator
MMDRDDAASALGDADYLALASFRCALREFLAFSEEAAQAAGLTAQQHQAILMIRGFSGDAGMTVGELAARLLLKHHTAVGLVDRLEDSGLVRRSADPRDSRRVLLGLTDKAEQALLALSGKHLEEIRRVAPELVALLRRIANPIGVGE